MSAFLIAAGGSDFMETPPANSGFLTILSGLGDISAEGFADIVTQIINGISSTKRIKDKYEQIRS